MSKDSYEIFELDRKNKKKPRLAQLSVIKNASIPALEYQR